MGSTQTRYLLLLHAKLQLRRHIKRDHCDRLPVLKSIVSKIIEASNDNKLMYTITDLELVIID